MNVIYKIRSFFFRYWMVLLPALLFGLLLLRNPYSDRTLIPNLEPYPDSIHYISPALGLLRGQGLNINREGRKLLPGVPPLYSLVLVPGFILNQDVRTFYIVNIVLAFVAFFFFYLIVAKITSNKFFLFLLMCLYATNYTLYWFPELAMAENLILPLILVALYLLVSPVTRRKAFLAGAIAVSFYATKFASLPLSVAVPFLYFVKILTTKEKGKRDILLAFFVSLGIWGGVYVLYEYVVRANNIIWSLLDLFWSLFSPKRVIGAVSGVPQKGGFFSLQYVGMNLSAYGHWLIGDPMYILWKNISILPKYLALVGWLGIIGSLFTKRRSLALTLFALLIFNMFFMMTFYAADGRYFTIAIPILLINIALCFSFIKEKLHGKARLLAGAVVASLCLIYAVSSLGRLKFDVMLNLKHAETPWYYISIRTFNEYLKSHAGEFAKEPVVISALPPYLVDFYSTEKFIIVPLSANQEFRTHKQEAWGNLDYDNLLQVYANFFTEGHPVILTGYGLGNEAYLHEAFDSFLARFTFQKVQDGCYSLCNIYRMTSTAPSKPLAAKKK